MLARSDKETVMKLLEEGKITQISRWETVKAASNYYKEEGSYICYVDEEPTHAFATPVMVFKYIEG